MPYMNVYNITQPQQKASFSGIFDDILRGINTGVKVAPIINQLIGGLGGGGGGSTKITGAAINQAGGQVIAQLQQLLAAMQGGQIAQASAGAAIDAGNQLAHILWDSNVFDTDGGHSILLPLQNQAVSLMAQVGDAARALPVGYVPNGAVGAINPTTGQPITSTTSILSDPFLLYGGIALIAIVLLKKK